ncbi:hypothetical protein WICPIJ_008643 [Wickerhamomyces pijperi]|uniref:Uncharacterized protein n=1 Tax=Wickerhamomyces pijperi TaxID=599730 RepID=A0A9P8TI68_WICPI|nr:hypothetical protein WICPIJ_008643 [Wickerhamomyces pijperi]
MDNHIPVIPPDNEIISPTFIVTDLLTSLGEKNQDPDYLVTKGNDLVTLLKSNPYIKDDLVIGAFSHRLQTLLTHSKKEVVATGYRISRYIISGQESIKSLIALRVDVSIILSLSKSHLYDIEREEALKLLRKFMDTPNGYKELTKGICASVLSIAGQSDDKLRDISLETCCEICLLRPDLTPPSSLVQFILDDSPLPFDILSLATLVIIKLLNTPQGRSYFTPGDIKRLISPITDFDQVDLHRMENLSSAQKKIQRSTTDKLNSTCAAIIDILKSFNGLYLFSLEDFEPMKTLLSCLRYPDELVVSRILDLLLDVLFIKNFDITPVSGKTHLSPLNLKSISIMKGQYIGIVISVLLSCGIVDNLVYAITKGTNEVNSTKAGFLLIELHRLSVVILPEASTNYFKQVLSNLHTQDTDIIYLLEGLSRKSNKSSYTSPGLLHGETTGRPESYIANKKTQIKDTINPLKIYGYIDDIKLKLILSDTNVLSSKNFSKWDCGLIEALFQGPLMNGKRIEEVNRTSKFTKRLLSFFRPFKNKFSATKKSKSSKRFINLGCVIFNSLLQTTEGIKILQESKILPQIAECLAQIDPYSGFHAKDQIFSTERLSNTLTSGYFRMLGTLAENKEGFELIEKWKIFSMLHHISDNHFRRDDVLILFLDNITFSDCDTFVVILEKCLHSENQSLKTRALRILKTVLSESSTNSHKSALELIVSELYESIYDETTRKIIIETLNDFASQSAENVLQVVRMLPNIDILRLKFSNKTFDHMNTMSQSLVFRFLCTGEGFNFLNKVGFIDEQFQMWINGGGYISYVKDIENTLVSPNFNYTPVNLFQELVKTDEGWQMILKSGVLTELVGTVKQYSILLNQNAYSELLTFDSTKLKACIWSIGFISGSEKAYQKLESYGCIVDLLDICRKVPFLDIKATCFYIFGNFAKSAEGCELLDMMAWQTRICKFHTTCGVVLPLDVSGFIRPFESPVHLTNRIPASPAEDIQTHDKVIRTIIKLVGGLCSHINFDKYSNELFVLSKSHPDYFKNPEIFQIVLLFFECYTYKFTIRKFIIELFNTDGKMLDSLMKRFKKRTKEFQTKPQ